ncbi:hypothetical protein MMC10_009981 [Thelotrema lepadinum]|nr:hypothetical protein [Thelotrema lepadinum]
MKFTAPLTATLFMATSTFAAPYQPPHPSPLSRQSTQPCFIVGSTALPAEITAEFPSLASVTCDASSTPIAPVPDVSSGGVSFSSINFADSAVNQGLSPLGFALKTFVTASPLAGTDLGGLQNQLNTYLATEAGLRSVSGSLAIKVPKFFIQFQIARVNNATGVAVDEAGTVEHQLGKVVKNAAGESQGLIDQVNTLAGQLT